MRYLILSDMHANWDAFEVVLRRARRKRFDAVLVLGDLVGYGGAPNQVVEAVRELGPRLHTVRGNHDKVVTGIDSGSNFNQTALTAAQWTTTRLTPANLRYVRDLPRGPVRIEEGLAICHGSPLDEDTYVFSDVDAWEIFELHGEPAFRSLEQEALRGTGELPDVVVATGGGTVTFEANARWIRANGVSVWLNPPFATIVSRIGSLGSRTGRSSGTRSRPWPSTASACRPTGRRT